MGPLHATSSPASHPSLLFILATMHLEMFTYDKRKCLYLHDSNQFSNFDFELLAKTDMLRMPELEVLATFQGFSFSFWGMLDSNIGFSDRFFGLGPIHNWDRDRKDGWGVQFFDSFHRSRARYIKGLDPESNKNVLLMRRSLGSDKKNGKSFLY